MNATGTLVEHRLLRLRENPRLQRLAGGVILVVLLVYCLGLLVDTARRSQIWQWDLRVYYYAAKVHMSGGNPYDPKALAAIAHQTVLPYVYPPVALWVLRPLAWMDYAVAAWVFATLKVFAAVALVRLWSRHFLEVHKGPLFWLFCLTAFSGAMVLDLRAGNLAIFEQLLLWSAFYAFVRGRLGWFATLVVLVSCVKVPTIVFLGMLLWTRTPRKYAYFLLACLAYVGIMLSPYALDPQRFSDYRGAITSVDERAPEGNPSSLALVRESVDYFSAGVGLRASGGVAWLAMAGLGVMVLIPSWYAARELSHAQGTTADWMKVLFACVVFTLLVPRLKVYSCTLLIVPTYVIFWRAIRTAPEGVLLILIVLFASNSILPLAFVWRYHLLMVVYCVWALYLGEILGRRTAELPAKCG